QHHPPHHAPPIPYTTLFRSPRPEESLSPDEGHEVLCDGGPVRRRSDPLVVFPHDRGPLGVVERGFDRPRDVRRIPGPREDEARPDRKSTRLNSSHVAISYAV